MSNSVIRITSRLDTIQEKFGLDLTDLKIIGNLMDNWAESKSVCVTDITMRFKIASPANIHYRVTRDLVELGFLKLEPNPEDARVKFVLAGKNLSKFLKFLEQTA